MASATLFAEASQLSHHARHVHGTLLLAPDNASHVGAATNLARFGDCHGGIGPRYFSVMQLPSSHAGRRWISQTAWPKRHDLVLLARSAFAQSAQFSTVLFGARSDDGPDGALGSLFLWNGSVVHGAVDVAHNLGATIVRNGAGKDVQLRLHAVGGQFFYDQFFDKVNKQSSRYDGLYVLSADRLADMVSGRWFNWSSRGPTWGMGRMGCLRYKGRGRFDTPQECRAVGTDPREPRLIIDGFHAGCAECREASHGACEYDGKNSLVRFRGRFWLYTRANLERYGGGRYVQVASSVGDDVNGPFHPFQPIDIAGYTTQHGPWTSRNIYFASVALNPLDRGQTLLGLFPVALTERSVSRRRRERGLDGFIGLALSCDAVHFSPLVVLHRTKVRDNRTVDQPVDGLVVVGEKVVALIHRNVPRICYAGGDGEPELVPHELDRPLLERLMAGARASLEGCSS